MSEYISLPIQTNAGEQVGYAVIFRRHIVSAVREDASKAVTVTTVNGDRYKVYGQEAINALEQVQEMGVYEPKSGTD